jgi:hypothetical protein
MQSVVSITWFNTDNQIETFNGTMNRLYEAEKQGIQVKFPEWTGDFLFSISPRPALRLAQLPIH